MHCRSPVAEQFFLDTFLIMLNCSGMKTLEATKIFEALSADVRLEVFRLLVRSAPDGLVAGEIARLLDVPATNLSFHLKAISHAGLVSVEKEGRFLRYRANIPLMLEMVAYLTEECCSSDPGQCLQYRQESSVPEKFLPPCPSCGGTDSTKETGKLPQE